MKKLTISGILCATLFSMMAWAGFLGYNGNTNLKIFDAIKCSTGLTCTKENNKFVMVSSPTVTAGTFSVAGAEATDGIFTISADESDDSGDDWAIKTLAIGNFLDFQSDTSGSLVSKFKLAPTGIVSLVNGEMIDNSADDVVNILSEDNDTTVGVIGFEAKDAILNIYSDQGDDNADKFSLKVTTADVFSINNNGSAVVSVSSGGAVTMVSTLAGFLAPQVAATATTITAAQCGSTFSNSGAVQIELPEASAVIGCTLAFVTLNAANFDVNPDNADQILTQTNAAGDAMRNATVGNSIVIRAVSASQWAVIAVNGTWSDIN